ncbi:MAG: response regulator [Deltaproteobacteria bacterium]|jgi:two-component system chemotaxis response regulator CheB|nr:response regulator [Deltaproteobacteria bacterium]
MIRVLIVDDSKTIRMMLKELLNADPEIEVVGEAVDGLGAIAMTRSLKPDLITMDVIMPVMDGLAATRRIMEENPTPIIVVTAKSNFQEMNVAFEAMEAGALDVVTKPSGFGLEPPNWETEFLQKVKSLVNVKPKATSQEK